jgi:hypothetical protein
MTLHDLNILPKDKLSEELSKCCGSSAWVTKMLSFFPADDLVELLEDAEEQWFKCSEHDWKEAFAQHPKIGDIDSLNKKFSPQLIWLHLSKAVQAERHQRRSRHWPKAINNTRKSLAISSLCALRQNCGGNVGYVADTFAKQP